ncbi:hypothetical protein K502DRAFT_349842 [Neoconidiobolus thromboides FSU 785]|nr:hypothetical protein K502DRAFT_349842 [Neoconidiobolus thromboides FSU 785]
MSVTLPIKKMNNGADIVLDNLPDGTKISRISCMVCRVHRKKCSRNYPSCVTCLKRGIDCEYPKRKVKNSAKESETSDVQPILYKQVLLGPNIQQQNLGNSCMTQVFKYHDIGKTSSRGIKGISKNLSYNNIDKSRTVERRNKKNHRSLSISVLKAVEIFSFILSKSGFNYNNQILFRNADGSMEYCGSSPVGTLLLSHLNLSQKFNTSTQNLSNVLPLFNKKQYQNLSQHLMQEMDMNYNYILEECTRAYFRCYSFFFPILDEKYLKDVNSPLLVKLVAAIGSKYVTKDPPPKYMIEWLDHQAISEFRSQFLSSKIEVIFGLMLIGQYQVGSTEFSSAWLYQSYNIIFTLLFGLNKSLPGSFNQTLRQKRLRCHHWWACCIQDKLNTSLLNRPMLLHANESRMAYPDFPKLPKLDNNPSELEFIMGRDQLAGTYFKYCVRLHELIGHATSCLKSRFDKEKNVYKAHTLCQALLGKFNLCFAKFIKRMDQITHHQPKWMVDISNLLKMTNLCYRNATIIRLCSYFQRYVDLPIHNIYDRIAAHASTEILFYANALKEDFFRFGLVYRLYAVSSATLVHARLASRNNVNSISLDNHDKKFEVENLPQLPNIQKCKELSSLGLNLLYNARPYLTIAEQFYKVTNDMMLMETTKD